MNREEVLKQLQSIFRNILKRTTYVSTNHLPQRCRWLGLANPHAIIAQIEKHFGVRFNFREVIKFKNVGDLCSALLTKME